jgi:hypothetical protein
MCGMWYGVWMAGIWLRGFVLCRQVPDREYRLGLRAAATKSSASRSLRTYLLCSQYNILYIALDLYAALALAALQHAARSPTGGRCGP